MKSLCMINVKAGTVDKVLQIVNDLKSINEIVSTETLIEVEVDIGW